MFFSDFFNIGIQHILHLDGLDHILFIVALCVVYIRQQWKSVLGLVTAFTIGHMASLYLSSFELLNVNTEIIEKLIPATILITSIINVINNKHSNKKVSLIKYILAAFFGCIHGLGFSNFVSDMLMGNGIITPLIGFNLGVEVGQIIIVLITFVVSSIIVNRFKIKQETWNIWVSGVITGMSLLLILNI